MAQEGFNPNRLSFNDCIERITRAAEKANFRVADKVITSRDAAVAELTKGALRTTNTPSGFHKWQLPLYMKNPTHLFLTVAEPGAKSPVHSHDDGDGIRVIAGGSIFYNGKELTAGDWMYIPAGAKYSFEVGPFGATMFYCYQC